MSSTDQNTPAAKPARRNRKAQRNRKPDQAQRPQEDQQQEAIEPIAATAEPADTAPMAAAAEEPGDTAPIDVAPIEAAAADTAPIESDAPVQAAPTDVEPPADSIPVSLQTIANAYGDYTRKSLEEIMSFVEKLKEVRSLDRAVEVQTEFAKQALEMFVAESQKIYGLHKQLAKQTLKPLDQLATKLTGDGR